MNIGQHVRFTNSDRGGAWAKGDYGTVEQVLAKRPQATADIYLIRLLDDGGQIVWATHNDIEFSFGEQLTLF